ncbi:hypothetical protein CBM2633_A110064 [Cupriavidus taiwanensis]|nr:hypothetical protein CBM2633_A110064 [Cupriavidus taiwanensis]
MKSIDVERVARPSIGRLKLVPAVAKWTRSALKPLPTKNRLTVAERCSAKRFPPISELSTWPVMKKAS